METPSKNFLNHGGHDESKNTNHTAQKRIFAAYLFKNVATCTMVAKATGIDQKCLTRYKRQLENAGNLIILFKGRCRVTNRDNIQYLSCNPDHLERRRLNEQ